MNSSSIHCSLASAPVLLQLFHIRLMTTACGYFLIFVFHETFYVFVSLFETSLFCFVIPLLSIFLCHFLFSHLFEQFSCFLSLICWYSSEFRQNLLCSYAMYSPGGCLIFLLGFHLHLHTTGFQTISVVHISLLSFRFIYPTAKKHLHLDSTC